MTEGEWVRLEGVLHCDGVLGGRVGSTLNGSTFLPIHYKSFQMHWPFFQRPSPHFVYESSQLRRW